MKKYLLLLSIFYFIFPLSASAAVLYSQSPQQDVYEGQSFVVDWFLDTEGKPLNSLDLKIDFSKDFLQVSEANVANSLVNLWIKYPTADNDKGQIQLVGGVANGINESKVPIFHSTFKATKTGTASISLNPDSQVLRNDGLGTQEQLKFKNLLFNVYPKEFQPLEITSTTHPDQNAWYSGKNVEINFVPKPGVEYSHSFSSNIEIIPDDITDQADGKLSYDNMPDGIYYFKINSKTGPSAWQETGVYRVQIDSTVPESFQPLIAKTLSVFDNSPFVSFSTVDKTSGISHYKVKVGLFGKSIETQSPYKIYRPLVGDTLAVEAYDQAGNVRVETVVWPGYISVNQFKWILVLIGLAALAGNWWRRKQRLDQTSN